MNIGTVIYQLAVSDLPFHASAQLKLIAYLDVSAASGIACLGQQLYVVADDLLELAVYDLQGKRFQSIGLLPGALPEEHAARKAKKPDFEALLVLPDNSLLALGSGSTAQRQHAVWVQEIATTRQSVVVDLSSLYSALSVELPELNIEGAVVFGPHLYLCSRGNGARRENALVQLDLRRSLASLHAERCLTADSIIGLKRVQLGELDGVPLSLTDLAVDAAGLIFCSAAEASANTYDDGVCAGSVIGRLSLEGMASEPVVVAPGIKLEGICKVGTRGLFAVADADDPHARAPLFELAP